MREIAQAIKDTAAITPKTISTVKACSLAVTVPGRWRVAGATYVEAMSLRCNCRGGHRTFRQISESRGGSITALIGPGGSEPTDILVLGTDIDLLNDWLAPDPDDDGEPIARMYIQGGRAYMFGCLIAPGANTHPFDVPASHMPYDFGDPSGLDLGIAITTAWNAAGCAEIGNGGSFTVHPTPNAGVFVSFDGVSWPLAVT